LCQDERFKAGRCVLKNLTRQGCRVEPTWKYSRRVFQYTPLRFEALTGGTTPGGTTPGGTTLGEALHSGRHYNPEALQPCFKEGGLICYHGCIIWSRKMNPQAPKLGMPAKVEKCGDKLSRKYEK
jgi:hypothetical protein